MNNKQGCTEKELCHSRLSGRLGRLAEERILLKKDSGQARMTEIQGILMVNMSCGIRFSI
jgi:hypothetical protein